MQVTQADPEPVKLDRTAAEHPPAPRTGGPLLAAPARARPARLRLQPDPGTVALLRQAPVILGHARNAGTTRRIETTYFDTADHLLFRQGLSLRVRKLGRRFVQTLSRRTPQAADASDAWSCDLPGAMPDPGQFAHLQSDWLPPMALEPLLRGPLAPVFSARTRRHTRRLEMPDAVVDLVFEDGEIIAQGRSRGVDRISLLLQAGEASALWEIGLRLLDVAPLRIGADSMVALGYGHVGEAGGTPARMRAAKAAASTLAPSLATDDAIAVILVACQAHLQANQGVAQDGRNAEGVHQMRVALRRMRSVLSLLRRDLASPAMAALAREARWAAGELGAARGWDVFLSDTLSETLRQRTGTGRPGLDFEALRQTAAAPRASAYKDVEALIVAQRFGRFQLTLGQWTARRGWRNDVTSEGLATLAEPASLVAARMLSRLHRKALRQGAHFRRLSVAERHELRITLKKLRYAVEFFLPLFAVPDHAHRFVRRLSRLQEALGLDHDAADTQPLLDELGRRSRAAGVHQAIGAVIGWQAREELANLGTLTAHWRRFRALPAFWPKPPKPPKPVSAEAAPAVPPQG